MYNVFMQPSNGGLVSFVPMIGMQSVFKNDAMPIDSQQFYSAFFNGDADGMRKAINDQKKFWPSIKAQLAAPCK